MRNEAGKNIKLTSVRNGESPRETTNIPDHFGNIMLSTHIPSILRQPDSMPQFSPLQRILLTSNGNLQLLLSSYHDAPVVVDVLQNIKTPEGYYDRLVSLKCNEKLLCIAKSHAWTISKEAKEAVESGTVGIGQLFRYLNILPCMELLGCGMYGNDSNDRSREDIHERAVDIAKEKEFGFWRRYVLSSQHLRCEIHEMFTRDCI